MGNIKSMGTLTTEKEKRTIPWDWERWEISPYQEQKDTTWVMRWRKGKGGYYFLSHNRERVY